jgi:hypothetical protein
VHNGAGLSPAKLPQPGIKTSPIRTINAFASMLLEDNLENVEEPI